MEEKEDIPNQDKYNTEGETTDNRENDSCVNKETLKLDGLNVNETLNSHDIKLKDEEENNSNTKDCVIIAKDYLKDEEIEEIFERKVRKEEIFEKDVEILKEDDKDHVKNLNANDDDKNIDTSEGKTTKGSKSFQENDTIEKIKQNEDSIEMKMDNQDVEDKDVFSGDEKAFKKYSLRKRQSIRYTFDEPPPKKKKVIVSEEENKTEYDCPICYTTYASKRGLSVHMVIHEQAEKFTCAQCAMEFLTNKQLIDHKKVHEADDTIFSCERCKVAYSNIMEFLLHKADHTKPGKKRNCEECGRVFNNRYLYKIHLPTHFSFTYNCDICHKELKNRHTCIQHMRSHENSTHYKCGECDKDCKSRKHFEYHMSTHTGVKLYQCLYCGKGFSNTAQRKVHTRIHTGERPFECEICKKTFKQSTDHKRHMLNHDSVKLRYTCDYCGRVYKQKTTLAIHMRIHTRKNLLSCPICNKKFPLHALLKSHYIYQHTTEKPFKCDTCKISFKRLTHLQRHLKLRKHNNTVYGLELKKLKCKENGDSSGSGQKT